MLRLALALFDFALAALNIVLAVKDFTVGGQMWGLHIFAAVFTFGVGLALIKT